MIGPGDGHGRHRDPPQKIPPVQVRSCRISIREEGVSIMKALIRLGVVLAVALFVIVGCSEETEGPKREQEAEPWPMLTGPEGVIETLLRSYAERDSEKYCGLLHEDYRFYLQDQEVQPGGSPFFTRGEDCESTRRMFLAAQGTPEGGDPPLERLDLAITEGSWQTVDLVGPDPCVGCLVTERLYRITISMIGPGGITTYTGNDIVMFYVAPVREGDETVYKLIRVYDIKQ
jgi:hypothetical protein